MAHFTILDDNNIVTKVVVIGNAVETADGPLGDNDKHVDGETYCRMLMGPGKYKQTSYNNNFRGRYAGIGFKYDEAKDEFISPQPFASWTLDSNNEWQPPVAMPSRQYTDGEGNTAYYSIPQWQEDNQRWVAHVSNEDAEPTEYFWNTSTSSWESI
tara:strand:- start:4403 stop:4870 length:468 start_codon:yes stop_codon:yes gene_type:complete